MKFVLFSILGLSISCAKPYTAIRQSVVDIELQPYVEMFEEDCNCNVDIRITFRSQDYNYIGVCKNYKKAGWKEIYIDPEYWYATTEGKRITLMYHELGHCVLDQDHRSNSIMYHRNFDATNNWDYYVNELFGRL